MLQSMGSQRVRHDLVTEQQKIINTSTRFPGHLGTLIYNSERTGRQTWLLSALMCVKRSAVDREANLREGC